MFLMVGGAIGVSSERKISAESEKFLGNKYRHKNGNRSGRA